MFAGPSPLPPAAQAAGPVSAQTGSCTPTSSEVPQQLSAEGDHSREESTSPQARLHARGPRTGEGQGTARGQWRRASFPQGTKGCRAPGSPSDPGIEATVTITADREHSPGTHQTQAWAWAAVGGKRVSCLTHPLLLLYFLFLLHTFNLLFSITHLSTLSVGTRSDASKCQAP